MTIHLLFLYLMSKTELSYVVPYRLSKMKFIMVFPNYTQTDNELSSEVYPIDSQNDYPEERLPFLCLGDDEEQSREGARGLFLVGLEGFVGQKRKVFDGF